MVKLSALPKQMQPYLHLQRPTVTFKQNSTVKAFVILQLHNNLYPNSANTHDSLGEIYEMMGNQSAALASYKKVLVLDPGNKNATARIKALSGK